MNSIYYINLNEREDRKILISLETKNNIISYNYEYYY
jgi:hypothetical protein